MLDGVGIRQDRRRDAMAMVLDCFAPAVPTQKEFTKKWFDTHIQREAINKNPGTQLGARLSICKPGQLTTLTTIDETLRYTD